MVELLATFKYNANAISKLVGGHCGGLNNLQIAY